MKATGQLVKPDADKYFTNRPESSDYTNSKLPALHETLITAFDEKSLFPGYILDFEKKMKNYHSMMLNQNQPKGKNLRGNLQNLGMQLAQPGGPKVPQSPRKSHRGSVMIRLGNSVATGSRTRKSSIATTSIADSLA